VTCGFRPAPPTRSRRPCAVRTHGSRDMREIARRRRPFPAAPEDVQFVPILTSFIRRAGFLAVTFAGIAPPRRLRSRRLTRASPSAVASASERLRLPGWACASVISELASRMRCPGSGLTGSRLALAFEAHAPASGDRERLRRPRTWSAEAILPPSPRRPAGVPSAETWPSPSIQRRAERPNRAAFERGVCGELAGSAGQEQSVRDPAAELADARHATHWLASVSGVCRCSASSSRSGVGIEARASRSSGWAP
jgi:hypothetical protein